MINFCELANDVKVLGNKVTRYTISGKTANFNAKILNLIIFFRSSEFFCESSDFCLEACGSTGCCVAYTRISFCRGLEMLPHARKWPPAVLPLCCYGKVLDFMIKKTLDSQKKH